MKYPLLALAAIAASPTFLAPTLAQDFLPAAGFDAVKLFDSAPGYTISAIGLAPNGDVYYAENDAAFMAPSRLWKRSGLDYSADPILLFDFEDTSYTSWILHHEDRVYFAESSVGKVYSVKPDGTGVDPLGMIPLNYDAVFGPDGALYVSASPDGFGFNEVFRYELIDDGEGGLMLSSGDAILVTDPDGDGPEEGDYSGPIVFDADGNLIYGSGRMTIGGVFRFSSAEVSAAIGDSHITLTPPENLILSTGSVQFFALDGTTLYEDDFGTLSAHDLVSGTSQGIGTTSHFLGNPRSGAGRLVINVTDFGGGRSSVYSIIPEPGSGMLAVLALGALGFRRRRLPASSS